MQAKEIEAKLYKYGELKHREESLKKQWDLVLEEKEARIERTTRPFGERLPDSNKVHDPTGDAVVAISKRYDDMIRSIVAQLATVDNQVADIELWLTKIALSQDEWKVIQLRYIDGRCMDDVAEQMSYSERHVRRMKGLMISKISMSGLCPL